MVVVGGFKVQLVDAVTKKPFKEHTDDDGNHYAEAEPGAEYFIQAQVLEGKAKNTRYYLTFDVDGKDLGYYRYIDQNDGPRDSGLWSQSNGSSKNIAIRCVQPKLATDFCQSASSIVADMMMGKITVNISEAIENGISAQQDFDYTKVLGSSPTHGDTGEPKKKMLRSVEGANVTTKKISSMLENYKKGALLHTISINYCTALGLIKVGILEKPPLWDFHRQHFGTSKRNTPDGGGNKEVVSALWKRKKRPAVYDDGKLVMPATEHDYIDLVGKEPDENVPKLISSDEDSDASVNNGKSSAAVVSQEP